MDAFFPEVIFEIFGIPVRDTVIYTWIMMALIAGIAYLVGRRAPTGLEMVVDFLNDLVSGIMRRSSEPYLPLLGSLAIFIAFANVIGVIPFLKPPTRDINTTLALALVVFFSVHYFGIASMGFMGYLRSLASPLFLLPLEIVSQISRTIALTIRLFGNVLSAEIIIVILIAMVPLFVPLPLTGFGIFTGLLQAYIFTALAAVYIATGMEEPEDILEEPQANKRNKSIRRKKKEE